MRRLLEVAQLPNVTMQVVPVCWHPGMSGELILTDNAAYTESLISGQVNVDEETVSGLAARFDSIRAEAMRASESVALIREMINRDRLAQIKLLQRPRRIVRRDGHGPRRDPGKRHHQA